VTVQAFSSREEVEDLTAGQTGAKKKDSRNINMIR
jgi:hypothetical protein